MRTPAIVLCTFVLLTSPAQSQEWVNIGIWGNGILGQQALRTAEAATRSEDRDKQQESRQSPTSSRAKTSASALSYSRSGAMTGQIEEAMAKQLNEVVSLRFQMDDPAHFVKSARTRALYRQELNARKLPEDSVGGATALFFAVGWELANGRKLTAAENAAILRQTTQGLQTTALARQSDARRQQEAEMRLIIAGLWMQEARFRAKSSSLTRELSDSVRKDLMAITGNDMRAYAVTASGFTER